MGDIGRIRGEARFEPVDEPRPSSDKQDWSEGEIEWIVPVDETTEPDPGPIPLPEPSPYPTSEVADLEEVKR
jgi:hypothetical protein